MEEGTPGTRALTQQTPAALDRATERLLEDNAFTNKYRVEGTIGKGGMGLVLAARHIRLDEPVAIKVLLPEIMHMEGMIDRFLREARSASKIKSQHVVRVLDVEVTPSSGIPYMVMERLAGTDLNQLCKKGGPIAVRDAIAWVLQACEAIGEAHALGIIHRDLKLGNLFLARRSDGSTCIKVLDFGLSKIVGEGALTRTGLSLGTLRYMSPEQMRSARSVDHRTDIWALGAILYRLITGSMPFPGEEEVEIISLVLSGSPPQRPSVLRPDAPPGLDAVILRCLERERERRFVTVAELVAALQPFAGSAARVATPAIGLPPTLDLDEVAPLPMAPTVDATPPDAYPIPRIPPTLDLDEVAPLPMAPTVDATPPDAYPIPRIAPIPAPPRKKGPGTTGILLVGLIVLGMLGLGAVLLYLLW
jgi:serine/threonine protein kinase